MFFPFIKNQGVDVYDLVPTEKTNSKEENKTNSVAENNKPSEMISGISEDVTDALVRTLLPDIISFYEGEERKAIFEKWKSEQTE